eukprot:509954_1
MSNHAIIIEPFYKNIPSLYKIVYLIVLIFACWKLYSMLQKHLYKALKGYTNETNTKRNTFTIEKSILKESSIILRLSLQIGLSLIFELCVETVSTTYFGHLSNS